jgi:hypothetical protein
MDTALINELKWIGILLLVGACIMWLCIYFKWDDKYEAYLENKRKKIEKK